MRYRIQLSPAASQQRTVPSRRIRAANRGQSHDRLVELAFDAVEPSVRKRAAPECRYVVVDAEGRIALAGVSLPREDLTFAVELDGRLPPGQYTVMAEILVNGNAMNLEIERIPVVIGGKP
jgi:hypothetical protein